MKLKREIFLDSPRVVARNLLGKELVRIVNDEVIVCTIVETEAYGGIIYIYLIYGIHHLLTIVTGAVGDPNAVFIRAVAPVKSVDFIKDNRKIKSNKISDLTNGTGKLTQGLAIAITFNIKDIINCDGFHIKINFGDTTLKTIFLYPSEVFK